MNEFKHLIAAAIKKVALLKDLSKEELLPLIETPPDSKLGDFAFPCFKIAAKLKKNPREIAEQLRNEIKLPKEFKEIKVEPGSVGLIPNINIINLTDREEIYLKYTLIIKYLINYRIFIQ